MRACVHASVYLWERERERDLQQYLISKVPSDRVTVFFFGRVIEASSEEKRYFFCYHLLATCSHNPHLLVVFCWCSVTNRNDRKVRRSQMDNTFCYLQPTFFLWSKFGYVYFLFCFIGHYQIAFISIGIICTTRVVSWGKTKKTYPAFERFWRDL